MITKEMLKAIAPNSKNEIIDPLVQYLDKHMEKYEVNTYLRICHFIAQAAHESASFRTLEEYASGEAYEGRKDLGNTEPGDGKRYKGRGIFQLTGRANYRDMSKKLGLDLEGNPELAETPEVSVLTALEYWKSRGLNKFADADDVSTITKRINGGFNGLEDRKKYLAKAKKVIPQDIDKTEPAPEPAPATKPSNKPNELEINVVVAKKGDNSPYVADLQRMLNAKGWNIGADGIFGRRTEQAVREFQMKHGIGVSGCIDTATLNLLMLP